MHSTLSITKLLITALVISTSFTFAQAEEAGDPDSLGAAAPVPPGWGDSNIMVENPDSDPDNNPDEALQNQGNVTPPVIPAPSQNQTTISQTTDPEAPDEGDLWKEMKFARLQGLNKITARTSELKSDIGAKTKFGNLEFVVEKCVRGPENEKAENTVLLTVWDEIPGQERKQIFRGWMFSSSPAISALEHPIYDIILLGCGEAPKPAAPAPEEGKKSKKQKMEIKVE